MKIGEVQEIGERVIETRPQERPTQPERREPEHARPAKTPEKAPT